MQDLVPVSFPVRASDVAGRREVRFDLRPGPEVCAGIAAVLGISAVSALRFAGTIRPQGRRDAVLEARLDARVVQPCVVTLEPVETVIAEPVVRKYVAEFDPAPVATAGTETEMPEDDTLEPMPEVIDVGAVLVEALALALPDYPRAGGAELGEAVFGPEGETPLRYADLRPFAALAALRARSGTDADDADADPAADKTGQ